MYARNACGTCETLMMTHRSSRTAGIGKAIDEGGVGDNIRAPPGLAHPLEDGHGLPTLPVQHARPQQRVVCVYRRPHLVLLHLAVQFKNGLQQSIGISLLEHDLRQANEIKNLGEL